MLRASPVMLRDVCFFKKKIACFLRGFFCAGGETLEPEPKSFVSKFASRCARKKYEKLARAAREKSIKNLLRAAREKCMKNCFALRAKKV